MRRAYGFVQNNPHASLDPSGRNDYSCGVSSFVVAWSVADAKGGKMAKFEILVTIRFRDDAKHKPQCCEYEQWVRTHDVLTRKGKPPVTELLPWHDDGYSRTSPRRERLTDVDGKPALTDPQFLTWDYPGYRLIDPQDSVDYTFTAAQYVRGLKKQEVQDKKHPERRCCKVQEYVCRVGPRTGTIKGKHPRRFDPTYWRGTGQPFTGTPKQDNPIFSKPQENGS